MGGGARKMSLSSGAASGSRWKPEINVPLPSMKFNHASLSHPASNYSNLVYTFLQLLQAIQVAEKMEKPPLADLFSDVYDVPPSILFEQEQQLRETIKRHPQDYPSDVPV